ncbi:hypothetical protein BDF19DRAFT_451448 [Syncephalis fuscata]|nr:hypothetical protein BDF19DRAFT_451448 [Syncephalis fuscata]
MDPDLAHKLGLNNVSQDSLSTSDNTTAVTEQPKDRVANRMTSSFSSAFSFMSNKEQNDTDNQSLAVDGNDSTFKTRFQTAASGFVSSFSIRRANSLMSMARNKAGTSEGDTSNTAAETTTTDGTTTTAATAIATSSTNHGSVAADAMVAESVTVVPPPRLSSKTNMEPADGKKKELTKAQKLKNKRSFLEQLRQAQVEEEEQLKAEAALADQAEGTDTATAAASEEAAPTSGARRLLHKMRSESRLLVTKQAPDTSRLDITVQLDDRQHFLLQAMRNVEYASLRASIWAELIRRQMPETLFAGKALVYRGTHGELTVSGDGPLREAVDDCLDGGNSHLVFHCI